MKKIVKQIALLCAILLLSCSAFACTPTEIVNQGSEWTEGQIAGFELPHTEGQAYNDDFYDYNSELFYLNETRISGADPGALYVSYDDIDHTYEQYMLKYKYLDEATGKYEWCDGWSDERFISENGTVEQWKEDYADYYYMIVTGGGAGSYGEFSGSSFQMWRSHDLTDWEECGVAGAGRAIGYDVNESWTNGSCSWAPEFIYDKATGLYFIWFSMECKNGYDNTNTYSPNNLTTGYTYDGLTLSCAYSINPLGPYRFATTKDVIEFQAKKDKAGNVITGTEKKAGPDLDRDDYAQPDAYFYDVYNRNGDVIGYKDEDGKYYNLNGCELTIKTPVMNVSYYYPRLATDERKLQDFENNYHLRNHPNYRNTDIDKYLWPAIDSNPVIDEDGNRYLFFSQHISYYNKRNDVWVVKLKDWMTPDWDTLTHIATPGYVTINQDGSFTGVLGDTTSWNEGSINEGTEVLYHEGKWYFTYSPFGYGSREYSPYVGVSDNPLGPYIKLGTEYSPIIGIGTEGNDYMSGTGHHCFIHAGEELWILYHCFYNPVNNNDQNGNFMGRCIGADRAYWKYVPDLGYDMLFGNGPTYNLQPKPETYTGYTNVGKYATITGTGDVGEIEYLTDGMVTSQPFSRQFEYGNSEGKLEIHYKWDKPVEITALMVYNSGGTWFAFKQVDSIVFKLASRPSWYSLSKYNGYCYLKDVKCDPNDYLKNFDVMRKASGAIAEFNPITVTEMYLYIEGSEENKYTTEDEHTGDENNLQVNVSEIYIFGNEA